MLVSAADAFLSGLSTSQRCTIGFPGVSSEYWNAVRTQAIPHRSWIPRGDSERLLAFSGNNRWSEGALPELERDAVRGSDGGEGRGDGGDCEALILKQVAVKPTEDSASPIEPAAAVTSTQQQQPQNHRRNR